MGFIATHHRLLIILAFACTITFLWLLLFRERLRMKWWATLLLSIAHVVFGVLCVSVFARMEGAGSGAMSIFGAVFFMPIGYYFGAKLFHRPVAEVFDIFAVPMIFTLFCSRINCLLSGCCYGLNIGSTDLRWPTRESEMLFYLIFLIIFAPRILKHKTNGEVYPLYMVCYGVFRAVNECFRYSAATTSILHISHLWAALSILLGLSVYLEQKSKAMKKRKQKT